MDEIERGKDARLQKWQKRLEDALPGTSGYSSALGMVRQLTKMPSAETIDLYAGAGSTARAYNYGVQSDHIHQAEARIKAYMEPQVKRIESDLSTGKLFFAPLNQAEGWPAGWTELGYTTEGASFSFEADFSADNLRAAFNGSTLTTKTDNPLRKAEQMIADHTATADELEQAALNLAAQAAAIRQFDATEPQGDEPTISFTHTFPHSDKAYTFVGFKCNREDGTGKWHLSGEHRYSSLTWRELGARFDAIANGDFLVVTKWGPGVSK